VLRIATGTDHALRMNTWSAGARRHIRLGLHVV